MLNILLNQLMTDITFDDKAFAKMMLHILKHVKSNSYGFLIGNFSNNEDKLEVTDVIPLAHSEMFVPQFDLALRMVSTKEGNKIIGMYANLLINYNKEQTTFSTPCLLYAEGIKQLKYVTKPLLLEISHHFEKYSNNNEAQIDSPEYKLYRFINGSYEEQGFIKENEKQYNLLKSLLLKSEQAEIIDFEEYLLCPELDWSNAFLKK